MVLAATLTQTDCKKRKGEERGREGCRKRGREKKNNKIVWEDQRYVSINWIFDDINKTIVKCLGVIIVLWLFLKRPYLL